jgi:alkylation response protein AidB-like acyl-CoA dehydrogenase
MAAGLAGLDRETLDLTLEAIRDFAAERLPDDVLLDLDAKDEFPVDVVRAMCGEELGVQLLFIPEEYEGMGGGAFDVYRVCEELARIDLGVATGVLATFLGCDPIVFGGTGEQKQRWMTRIASEGLLMAYCATEPDAGSDLGALRSVAVPVQANGHLTGYRISGNKCWISNGGFADLYSVLALTPGGPSWFVVERGAEGLSWGKPEDKHGIRASNTAQVHFDDVEVTADDLVGGVEGQGLIQAQLVFGYTRLMVAAFGLGGGWAALDRAIPYSQERIQAGGPLSEKQGFTHKLIVPHAVRLEAARAFIEETAERIDAGTPGDGGDNLNTEGAIAKYMASEAGNAAADAAVQAHGGYGYVREYMVEKIRRDVRITTIYEGTSEILEMTIARDRWQLHLKTRGAHYQQLAARARADAAAHPDCGGATAALALAALAAVMERCRASRLTRNQHVLFRLGELISWAESAAVFSRRAARAADGTLSDKTHRRFQPPVVAAMARVFAREAAHKVALDGLRWVIGAGGESEAAPLAAEIALGEIALAQAGSLADMDLVADALYARRSVPQADENPNVH